MNHLPAASTEFRLEPITAIGALVTCTRPCVCVMMQSYTDDVIAPI